MLAGGVSLAAAPVASAAAGTVTVTTDCNSDVQLRGNIGDTVVIDMTAGCLSDRGVVWNINGPSRQDTASGFFGPATFDNSPNRGPSSKYVGDWFAYSNGTGTTRITTTLNATNGAGSTLKVGSYLANIGFVNVGPYGIYYSGPRDVSSDSPPIPDWVQAYGIFHHDDPCQTAWTNSWQEWAEPITGGWVCTRTIPSLG